MTGRGIWISWYKILINNKYMSSAGSTSSSGIGFVGLLTIVFIVLKLLNKIDWSWWWILSPLWISFILILLLGGIAGIIYVSLKK